MAKKRKRVPGHAHEHTGLQPAAAGAAAAVTAPLAPGTLARQAVDEVASVCAAAGWAPPATRTGVPRSPHAAVEVEVARARALDRLRAKLAALCKAGGLTKTPLLAFERWRFTCKWAEDDGRPLPSPSGPAQAAAQAAGDPRPPAARRAAVGDPVIPFGPGGLVPAPEAGLAGDLAKAGMGATAAAEAAAQLAAAAAAAAAATSKLAQQLASGRAPSPESSRVTLAFHRHSIDLQAGGQFVMLTRPAYGKMAALHRQQSSGGEAAPEPPAPPPAAAAAGAGSGVGSRAADAAADAEAAAAEAAAGAAAAEAGAEAGDARAALHARLFALLLRYKLLQGHGFQAAAGPAVFEVLRRRLAVGWECFASPLNCAFDRFASAFPDVDAPFGSCGSFFRLQLAHGSCEANPPFVTPIMDAAAEHMTALLEAAEAAGGALSFAVILPGWQEVAGWQRLSGSPFLRARVLVAAADHGFCDGASHQRRDPFRRSPFDTGVFVLQTTRGAAKWRLGEGFEQELRAAFGACLPSAAAEQRQRDRRGESDFSHWGLAEAAGARQPRKKKPAGAGHAGTQQGGAAVTGPPAGRPTARVVQEQGAPASSAAAGPAAGSGKQRSGKQKSKKRRTGEVRTGPAGQGAS